MDGTTKELLGSEAAAFASMNTSFLIDSIVRQTTVLLAQLATTHGSRTPVAHLANQVFLELAEELERQGLSRKVSADMFGMALRAYQRKVQRLRETANERGTSLWEAILAFVTQRGNASEFNLLDEFPAEAAVMRGVLHDLVSGGLLVRKQTRRGLVYRIPEAADVAALEERRRRARDALIRAIIFSKGPLTRDQLRALCQAPAEELDASVQALLDDNQITDLKDASGEITYRAPKLEVLFGQSEGWEAAVFDHYQAACSTITAKLRERAGAPKRDHLVGGSTYHFEVWDGHPMQNEVRETLSRLRDTLGELRARVEGYNDENGLPREHERVTAYVGQVSRAIELDSRTKDDG